MRLRKIKCIWLFALLFLPSLCLSSLPATAASEFNNVNHLWFKNNGFYESDPGGGFLFLSFTYTNMSPRTIDYVSISFNSSPFQLQLFIEEKLKEQRDSEGNIVWKEPSDGYIYIMKNIVDSFLNGGCFASLDFNYSTVSYNGELHYRIHVSSFNRVFCWKLFDTPDNNTWYTWGSKSSVSFTARAMYVKQISHTPGHLILDISHPRDNSGQVVAFSKSYLESKGIRNPYFEWGDKIPWHILSFEKNSTHYFIHPPSFSLIGIHESATGTTSMRIKADNTIIWTNNTGSPGGQLQSHGWQSFKEPISEVLLFDIYQHSNYDVTIKWGLTYENNSWVPGSTITVDCKSGWNRIDIPDTCIDFNVTHKMRGERISGYMYWGYLNGNPYPNGRSDIASNRDYLFRLKGSNEYYKNGTSRIAGSTSERNIVDINTRAEYVSKKTVLLKVPVSNKVKGIIEVLNQTSMLKATEVSSLDDVVNNTFFYDSTNQFVYIGTTNLSKNQVVNWSINCTYGSTFAVEPPTYLRSGDNFAFRGLIKNASGIPISGVVATTRIFNASGMVVASSQWNCSNGNYECDIATTSIVPGVYSWETSVYDSESGITFKKGGPLYIDVSIPGGGEGPHASAHLYYSFYDIGTGSSLSDDYFKIYISPDTVFDEGDRVKGGIYGTYLGQTLHYRITDFFNNKIYPTDSDYSSVYIANAETYLDIGVSLRQFRIKNMNQSTVYFTLRNNDMHISRWIPPYEESEFFVLDGDYNLTIQYYHNKNATLQHTYYIDSFTIDRDIFYWISGYCFDDVIDEVEEEGTWLYYTIFDMNTGSQLGDDYYKVYFSTDTVFNEDDRVKGGKYKTTVGSLLHFKVLDYWNNTIYPVNGSYENISIINTKTFLDIGIPLNQFLVKNVNDSLIYFRMTNGDFSDPVNQTWYNRWIPPGGSIELFIRSSVYNISLEYYYPNNGSFIKYENISNMSVLTDTFYTIRGYNARVYFCFYNTNDGLGLPTESLKTYVNDLRLPFNHVNTHIGRHLRVVVKDYFDYILYNSSFNVSSPLSYLDLGLTFYSYKFTNSKDDYYVVGLQRNGSTRWWEKIVGPFETIEFLPPAGNYKVRVYNASLAYAEFNVSVNSSSAFVIEGNVTLTEILDGQGDVVDQLSGKLEVHNSSTSGLLNQILGDQAYVNQTTQSILEQFRLPHTWRLPDVNYTMEDTTPPISAISATIALGGGINVRWHSTDNQPATVNYTMIYYRLGNASWRVWMNNATAQGEAKFDSNVERLVDGATYWFKCIGVDKKGNVEEESDTNTCNVTYYLKTLPTNPYASPDVLLVNSFTDVYLWVVLLFIALLLSVIFIRRRQLRRRILLQSKKKPMTMFYGEEF